MAHVQETPAVHCYTNPAFSRHSEYLPGNQNENDLPPPPQFPIDDLPPPPPLPPHPQHQPQQLQPQQQHQLYGQSNPAFQSLEGENTSKTPDRYGYLEENRGPPVHKRYASVPIQDQHQPEQQLQQVRSPQQHRYEYIQEDEKVQQLERRWTSARYDYIPQQAQQRSTPVASPARPVSQHFGTPSDSRYAIVNGTEVQNTTYAVQGETVAWEVTKHVSPMRRQINTPQGRYTSLPLQDEDPPELPERNGRELAMHTVRNSTLATQKLHEILATPRKPRSRSEERTLSPKRHHIYIQSGATLHRKSRTPGCSPPSAGRALSPSAFRPTPQGTPQGRSFSSQGPMTSTPNKEPSARRCLPLTDLGTSPRNRPDEAYQTSIDLAKLDIENGPRYNRYPSDNNGESTPMMNGNSRYRERIVPMNQKQGAYCQNIESAFLARTAVVPPLSPPTSDANTTMASGVEKMERRNAPLLLVLVGVLTCGLALYLSWTQGRRYYYDSAVGCGACCALAGACRSLRRTWTGLGLAGLAALSCAGLLVLAAKAPRPGSALHDVTAGALCGVSLLGAALALIALLRPKCTLTRHRRVHSWIPRFTP